MSTQQAPTLNAIMKKIVHALTEAGFDEQTISVTQEYGDKLLVIVTSNKFKGKSDKQRQGMVWPALKDELGADAQLISLAVTMAPDDLKNW